MIKLAGFLIILFSAVKIGFDMSQKYINRSKELKGATNALELMCKELNFTMPDVADMLWTASKVNCKNIKRLFEGMSDVIKSDMITPLEAFNKCKNNIDFALDDRDFQVISDYFAICGNGCVDDELNSIKLAVSMLNQNYEAAILDENKYVKLFRFTGLVAGLMLSIILI